MHGIGAAARDGTGRRGRRGGGGDIAALLDPGDWKVITGEAPQRSAPGPDGRPVKIRDTVFRARRGG